MTENKRQMDLMMWRGLCHIAEREKLSVDEICDLVERNRGDKSFEQATHYFTVAYVRALTIETMKNYVSPVLVPNEDDQENTISLAS